MEIREKVSLKEYAWWKIGGVADYFCLPTSIDEVREAVLFAASGGHAITVLGGGTNVLISDAGIEGLVICMRSLVGVSVSEGGSRDGAMGSDGRETAYGGGSDGRTVATSNETANYIHIEAMAGAPKSELVKIFMKRKLAPALFLCGLPGDVGGGVVMNAGVSEKITPREFVEIVDWVEVLGVNTNADGTVASCGELRRFTRNDLQWKYRASSGWEPGIVVRVGLSWTNDPDDEIPRKVKDATKNRLQRQPLELPSCGSTFKNPSVDLTFGLNSPGSNAAASSAAGALIERAGLKGYQVGGAQVSPKHANFIVNITGTATAADVIAVIRHVQTEVKRQFGVALETEVRLLGRW